MKLLVDMNLSPRWISMLIDAGSELEEGALLTVDPNRTRLHVLPLRQDKQNLSDWPKSRP